jgi:hypothetical protein
MWLRNDNVVCLQHCHLESIEIANDIQHCHLEATEITNDIRHCHLGATEMTMLYVVGIICGFK